jgi:ribonuclease P protein component
MATYSFTKEEKLCSKRIISEMFLTANTFLCHPLKVVWIKPDSVATTYPAQIAFSVPKKNINRAHDRNQIRRKMRESFRYAKGQLYEYIGISGQKIALMIVYIGKEIPEFHQVESAMTKVIYRLEQEIK